MQVATARQELLHFAHVLQTSLLPILQEEIGPLGPKAKLFVEVLAMAAAFLAKAVFNLTTTRSLMETLRTNPQLLRLCGWHQRSQFAS